MSSFVTSEFDETTRRCTFARRVGLPGRVWASGKPVWIADVVEEPVGFIDDDPAKKGRVIHGLRVFGDYGRLRRECIEQQVEEVVISSARFPKERIAEVRRECQQQGITLRQMRIAFEQLTQD